MRKLSIRQTAATTNGLSGTPGSEASARKMWESGSEPLDIEDVRLHDVSRSCASYWAIDEENMPGDLIRPKPSGLGADQHLCLAQYESDRQRLAVSGRSVLSVDQKCEAKVREVNDQEHC